jgi:replicative DNA helicase
MDLPNINKDRIRRKAGSLELGTMAFGKVPPQAKEL